MTVAALQTAVRQLQKEDRKSFLSFVLGLLKDVAGEFADDLLRAVADLLESWAKGKTGLVFLLVGIAVKALDFAADRLESDNA